MGRNFLKTFAKIIEREILCWASKEIALDFDQWSDGILTLKLHRWLNFVGISVDFRF